MEATDRVLKTDAKGRVWTPAGDQERILDEFERSGVPATKFAALVGVKYQTLASWIQKRRRTRETEVAKPAALNWAEAAVVECPETSGALVVQMPGGVTMMVSDPAQAALAGLVLRACHGEGAAC